MKKITAILLCILSGLFSFSQSFNNHAQSSPNTIEEFRGVLQSDVGLFPPFLDTLANPVTFKNGALTVRPQEQYGLYMSNGSHWKKVGFQFNVRDSLLYYLSALSPVTLNNGVIGADTSILATQSDISNFWSTNGNSVSAGNFLGTTNSNPLIFKVNNSQAAVIDNTGKVGINIANPTNFLHVYGTGLGTGISVDGNDAPGIRFNQNGSFFGSIGISLNSTDWLNHSRTGDLSIRTDTTSIRIDKTGFLNTQPSPTEIANNIATFGIYNHGQIAVNTYTPDTSAALDIVSLKGGLLIPRMSGAQMNAIYQAATGLQVYCTDSVGICFYNGTKWVRIGTGGGGGGTFSGWGLSGNSGTTTSNFIGTTDNIPFTIKSNNIRYGLFGDSSVFIGANSGTGHGKLWIGSGSGIPLIYGDFLKPFVSINGGISNSDSVSAIFSVSGKKGVVFPRMNDSTMKSIPGPTIGLIVFNYDSAGYCYYNGASWLKFTGSGAGAGGGSVIAIMKGYGIVQDSTITATGVITVDTSTSSTGLSNKYIRIKDSATLFKRFGIEDTFGIKDRFINFKSKSFTIDSTFQYNIISRTTAAASQYTNFNLAPTSFTLNRTHGAAQTYIQGVTDSVISMHAAGVISGSMDMNFQSRYIQFIKDGSTANPVKLALRVDSMKVDTNYVAFFSGDTLRKGKLIGGAGGGGGVSSITRGWGLLDSTTSITSTGYLRVDTAALKTRFLRLQDSVGLTGFATNFKLSKTIYDSLVAHQFTIGHAGMATGYDSLFKIINPNYIQFYRLQPSSNILMPQADSTITFNLNPNLNITSLFSSDSIKTGDDLITNGILYVGGGLGVGTPIKFASSVFSIVPLGASTGLRIGTSGQVSIGSSSFVSPAELSISSTTKGFLMPLLNAAQKNTLASTAVRGLMIIDTTTAVNAPQYFNGTAWVSLGSGSSGGTVSFDPVGNTPNTAGASVASNVIKLQPADSISGIPYPGIVSLNRQTFVGEKDFNAAPSFVDGFYTGLRRQDGNLWVNHGSTISGAFTYPKYMFPTGNFTRGAVMIGSTTNLTISNGDNANQFIIGKDTLTTPSAGNTVYTINQGAILTPTIISGGATVLETNMLYISDTAAVTTTTGSFAIHTHQGRSWFEGGIVAPHVVMDTQTNSYVGFRQTFVNTPANYAFRIVSQTATGIDPLDIIPGSTFGTIWWNDSLNSFRGVDHNAKFTFANTSTSQLFSNKIIGSSNVIGGVTMTLGSDATGDMYYRNSSGVLTRIAIGTSKQTLHGGTIPSFADTSYDWRVGGNSISFADTASNWLGTSNNVSLRFKTNSTGRMIIDSVGRVGIGTISPTHSLTLSSSGTGLAYYNTTDQTTNYERLAINSTFNTYNIASEAGGTGVNRVINIQASGIALTAVGISLNNNASSSNTNYTFTQLQGTTTATSGGTVAGFGIYMNYNQSSSTTSNTDLAITRNQSSVGSGTQRFIDAKIGAGASRFSVSTAGDIASIGGINVTGTITGASFTMNTTTTPTVALGTATFWFDGTNVKITKNVSGTTTTGTVF